MINNSVVLNESDLRKDFAEYTDQWGLLQLHKNPGTADSDNGPLFTAHYVVLLSKLGFLTTADKLKFIDTYYRCMHPHAGLPQRSPINTSQEGPDDFHGYATASYLCCNEYYKDCSPSIFILDYGRNYLEGRVKLWGPIKVNYNYNNTNPGVFTGSSYMGRFPQLITHLEWASGEKTALWRQLYWGLSVLFGPKWKNHSDTDSKILSWHLLQVAGDRNFWTRFCKKVWTKRLYKYYTNGMKDIFTIYFGSEHPLAKWWPREVV